MELNVEEEYLRKNLKEEELLFSNKFSLNGSINSVYLRDSDELSLTELSELKDMGFEDSFNKTHYVCFRVRNQGKNKYGRVYVLAKYQGDRKYMRLLKFVEYLRSRRFMHREIRNLISSDLRKKKMEAYADRESSIKLNYLLEDELKAFAKKHHLPKVETDEVVEEVHLSTEQEHYESEGRKPTKTLNEVLVAISHDSRLADMIRRPFIDSGMEKSMDMELPPVNGDSEVQSEFLRQMLSTNSAEKHFPYATYFELFNLYGKTVKVPEGSLMVDYDKIILSIMIDTVTTMYNQTMRDYWKFANGQYGSNPLCNNVVVFWTYFVDYVSKLMRVLISSGLVAAYGAFLEQVLEALEDPSIFRGFKCSEIRGPIVNVDITRNDNSGFTAEGSVVSTVKTFVSSITNKVVEYVTSLCTLMGRGMSDVLSKVKDWIVQYVGSWFGEVAESCVGTISKWYEENSALITKLAWIIGCILCYLIGLMSGVQIGAILGNMMDFHYQAEGNMKESVGLITTILVMLGSCFPKTDYVTAKFKEIAGLLNFSGSLSKILVSLLAILPFTIRDVIANVFGDEKTKRTHQATEIIKDWAALRALSYDTSVYQTQKYVDELGSLCNRICALLDYSAHGDLAPSMVSLLSRTLSEVTQLYGQLGAGMVMPTVRPFPFWLHFYGEPGIGKSVLVKRIVESAPGRMLDPHNLEIYPVVNNYYRSVADQFWSCYNSSYQITTIDEFLNYNTAALAERSIVEMLSLCSCSPYTLPMPAVESSRVGIKGQQFESTMVITCNNTDGFPVCGNLGTGLQRRRNLLVHLGPSAEYKKYYVNNQWLIPANIMKEMKPYDNVCFTCKVNSTVIKVDGLSNFLDILWQTQNAFAKISNHVLGETYHYVDVATKIKESKLKVRGLLAGDREVKPEFEGEGKTIVDLIEDYLRKEDNVASVRGQVNHVEPMPDKTVKHVSPSYLTPEEFVDYGPRPGQAEVLKAEGTFKVPVVTNAMMGNKVETTYLTVTNDEEVVVFMPGNAGGVLSVQPFKNSIPYCVNHFRTNCEDEQCKAHFYVDCVFHNIMKVCEKTLFRRHIMPKFDWETPRTVAFWLAARHMGVMLGLPKYTITGKSFVAGEILGDYTKLKFGESSVTAVPSLDIYYDPKKHVFVQVDVDEMTPISVLRRKGSITDDPLYWSKESVDVGLSGKKDVPSAEFTDVEKYKTALAEIVPEVGQPKEQLEDEETNLTQEEEEELLGGDSFTAACLDDVSYEAVVKLYEESEMAKEVKFADLERGLKLFSEKEQQAARHLAKIQSLPKNGLSKEAEEEKLESSIVSEALKYGLGVVAITTGLYVIGKIVGFFTNSEVNAEDYQPEYRVTKDGFVSPTQYGVSEDPDKPQILSKSTSEAKAVECVEFNSARGVFYAVPLKENYFLTFSHGLPSWLTEKGLDLELKYVGNSYRSMVYPHQVVVKPNHDYCVFKFNAKTLPQFSKVVNLLCSRSDLEKFKRKSMGFPINVTFNAQRTVSAARYLEKIRYRVNGEEKVYKDGFVYDVKSFKGCCGTPIFADDFANVKMVGIHVAGSIVKGPNSHGLGQFVLKESVNEMIDLLNDRNVPPSFLQDRQPSDGFEAEMDISGPNLLEVQESDCSVFVPGNNEFRKSPIYEELKSQINRAPSIVNSHDPRAEGQDPLYVGLSELASWSSPSVEVELLKTVKEDLKTFVASHMDYHGFDRILTMDEAVAGIPGILNSVKVSSSLGYPLCLTHGNGKSELIQLRPNDTPLISPEFIEEVEKVKQKLEKNEIDDYFRFLAYPKSELQKTSKIATRSTRVIYSGNTALVVLSRMWFGCLFIGFIKACPQLGLMSMNQYSKDLHMVYEWLRDVIDEDHCGLNFIAGDLKRMDQHYIKEFQMAAYDILYEVLPSNVRAEISRDVYDAFVKTQVSPLVQYKGQMYRFDVAHLSGCCFTTIVNNLVISMYMRYMFAKIHPNLVFDECCRMVMQGDDHLIAVNRNKAPLFTQLYLEEKFPEFLAQTYTNEDKSGKSIEPFRKWEEVSILGSHPVLIEGLWTGALRKNTIFNSLGWYRKDIGYWRQTCEQMLEYASLWEQDFFEGLCDVVNRGLVSVECAPLNISYGIRRVVANRTTNLDETEVFEAESLTNFSTDAAIAQEISAIEVPREGGGIGGVDDDLNVGLDSYMYKDSFVWDKTSSQGTLLYAPENGFPFCMIEKVDNDLQSTKFKSFQFYRSNFKLRIQVNGNKMQQGGLCVFFLPLYNESSEITIADWTTLPHIILQPSGSGDYVYEIPFRHMYPFIRTNDPIGLGRLRIGVWSPLSYQSGSPVTVSLYLALEDYMFSIPKLLEAFEAYEAEGAEGEVTNTVNEPNAEQTVVPPPVDRSNKPKLSRSDRRKMYWAKHKPRSTKGGKPTGKPVKPALGDRKPTPPVKKGGKANKKGGRKFFSKSRKPDTIQRAQESWNAYVKRYGQPPAVTENEILYAHKKGWLTIDKTSGAVKTAPKNFCTSLLGDMVSAWIEKGRSVVFRGADNAMKMLDSAEDFLLAVDDVCEALGFFDNPNVAAFVKPVQVGASSMSNVSGAYYAKNMDLHPVSNYKPGRFVMDPSEMNFDYLFSREARLATFNWTSSQEPNTKLLEFNLDSILTGDMSVPLCALNQFQFFHCDYIFRLYVFKTMFHTGRIRAVIGYGYHDEVPEDYRSVGTNRVLDFGSGDTYQDFTVPWEAPTDFLRTYDGPRSLETNKTYMGRSDFSLGRIRFEVANTLCLASDTVPMNVSCVLTVRLANVRVAVPKVTPTVTVKVASTSVPVVSNNPGVPYTTATTAEMEYEAEAEEVLQDQEIISAPDYTVSEPFPDEDVVEEGTHGFTEHHDDLDIGAQFEFLPSNVLDIARRFVELGRVDYPSQVINPSLDFAGQVMLNYHVRPVTSPLTALYRGYSGGLVVRVFSNTWPIKAYWTPTYGGRNLSVFTPVGYLQRVEYDKVLTTTTGIKYTIVYSPTAGAYPVPAVEMIVPSGGNNGYVDLVLPYQQHVFFMTKISNPDFVIGNLAITGTGTNFSVRVFQKVADDGSYGIFCPPIGYDLGFKLSNIQIDAVNGYFL